MKKLILILASAGLFLPSMAQKPVTQTLHSGWEFSQSGLSEWLPATVPGTVHTDLIANGKIPDPYYRMVEHDVQWIDKVGWDYRTMFDATDEVLAKQHIEIVFDGLDTYATVWLNDKKIITGDNMFLAWRAGIKGLLRPKGNVLRVHFDSPTAEGLKRQEAYGIRLPAINDQSENGQMGPNQVSIFTRKAGYHYGWDWGPRFVTSGIWRPVCLEAWNDLKISNVYVETMALPGTVAKLRADVTIIADRAGTDSLVLMTGKEVWVKMKADLKPGENHISREFVILNPKLWWPRGYGDQYLYTLTCRVSGQGGISSEYTFRTGVRTVKLVQNPDADGNGKSFYFEVNGVPVFAKGANYIPSDMFVPRMTGDDYRKVVGSAAFANMNMLRVWGGGIYENDIFYDLCDENGIMIWQDFMFACSMYPGTPDLLSSIAEEAKQNVTRLRRHPAMVLWCGNNEMEAAWGPYQESMGWGWKLKYTKPQRDMIWHAYDTVFHSILPHFINALTPSLPYWHSSPSAGMGILATNETRSGDNHYWGVWHQKHPFTDYTKYISRFMSEYGFQSFPEYDAVKRYTLPEDENIESPVMSSHQRSGIGNLRIREYMAADYRVPEKFDDFLYVSHLLQAEGIKTAMLAHRRNKPYCMGTLYWQLNDCWPVASWSSTDFYRNYKAVHYFARKAYEPVIVIPSAKAGQAEFRIVSDKREKLDGTLKVTAMTLEGKVLYENTKPISVEPLGNTVAATLPVNTLTAGHNPADVVIRAAFTAGKDVSAADLLYLVRPKELELSRPMVTLGVRDDGTDWAITVVTDKVAKNIMVTWKGRAGIFSDNYFDLLPGPGVTIRLSKSVAPVNPVNDLSAKSLADTITK